MRYFNFGSYSSVTLNLVDGKPFSHFLIIDISGEEFEAPAYFINLAIQAKRDGYNKLCIPMFVNSTFSKELSMVPTILNYFSTCSWSERLKVVKTKKDELYYGMPGLLLDKDFKILFLTTVTVRVHEDSITLTKASCRIPYEIFERQDELMPKAIYKKLIPMYATSTIPFISPVSGITDRLSLRNRKADIIIGTGTDIMFTPVLPQPSTANDEEYHRLIRNNINLD